ncbi:probable RNA-directed DNA polymerase from transposon BS [Trichonephila clavipes]|nr:probable RNA-directed DNA polymerase from transposon BS [Trichonephila clavipes]
MNPSLPVVDTASPVAQVIKGRDRGLGRGPRLTSALRSPTESLKILQCNINGLSTPAMRTKLEQLIDIVDRNGVQIVALQETKLSHLPAEIFDCSDKNTIFLSDLNAKHQSRGCSTNNDRGNDLLNADDDRALIFLNSGLPTHTSFSYGTSEALDITLVSPELHPHCDWDILSSIGSDHLPILINVENRKTVTSDKKFWNFKKANWDCFQRITEGSFDKRTTMDNLEQEWHNFKQVIIQASKQSIPRGNFKHLKSYFQYRDPGLRALILKRNALHRKLTLTGDREDKRLSLTNSMYSIKQLYIKLKREVWTDLCSNIDAKTPNTKLWKLAQSLSYNQPQNMPCNTVLTSDGKAAPDDKTTANVLGEFYKGVGNLKFNQNDVILKNRSKRMIHTCRTSSSGNHIFINKFTLTELNFALRAMDLRKSPGPDGIHGFLIGHLRPHGMQKLLDIFNFSCKIGHLPRDWKRAIIIPILKPGKDTRTSASYRPIALTSFVCKLMERLILARLNVHLNMYGLLPSDQYGYRKGHGAVDQILYFCQRIRDAQNKKPTNHTVVALLDMSRAFDRVWRQLLITKLHDYFSIRGRALPWISVFLWDRSIRVKYNNCLSDPLAIRQDVPQGSVLSPVLFSLYITGIEKVLAKHCEVGIFADDITV